MDYKYLVLLVIFAVAIVAGCVNGQNPIVPAGGNDLACRTDYIFGGTLTGDSEKYESSCSRLCSDQFKLGSYRIDPKTSSIAMCYCDINECSLQ